MKLSLRTKLLGILLLTGALPLLLALIVVQTLGFRHLVSVQGAIYQSEATHVGHDLQLLLERDVKNLSYLVILANLPALVEGATKAPVPADLRQSRTSELNTLWKTLPLDSPEVQSVLHNELAAKLRAFQRANPLFVEILVADSEGRLLAATGKTTDYDQSDESWWRQTMHLGGAEAVLGGLDLDESTGVFSLDISLPVLRSETPRVVLGVMKVVVNASPLFASVPLFSPDFEVVGEVVHPNGRILLRLGDKSFTPTERGISEKARRHLQPGRPGWFLAPLDGGGSSMVGFAPFHLLGFYATDRGIAGDPFYVVVHNRADVVLAPLRQRVKLILVAGAFILLACAGTGVYLAQTRILVPLERLRRANAALAAAAGHPRKDTLTPEAALESVARIRTGDELETLARDFTAMARRLLRYQEALRLEIAEKSAEIQGDLDMARDFQQAFLPRNYPCVPTQGEDDSLTLNFHHLYQAALSVSGDFCHVIKLSDHRVGVFIADVMGHGTRSALVTAILRTLLHGLTTKANEPGHFLSALNQEFRNTIEPTGQVIFASACYLVIDTREEVVRCATAGHPSPLKGNRLSAEIGPLYGTLKNNPALGLFPTSSHTVFTSPLREEDVFLLFTDGVIEAMDSEDQEFGRDRLEHAARDNLRLDLASFTQAIIESVFEFTGRQMLLDDVCLVAVEALANSSRRTATARENSKQGAVL